MIFAVLICFRRMLQLTHATTSAVTNFKRDKYMYECKYMYKMFFLVVILCTVFVGH